MSDHTMIEQAHSQEAFEETYSKTILGFWLYLMTDCILFATIFAVYVVLQNGTFGGSSAREIFNLPLALSETLILLTCSFACGPAHGALLCNDKNKALIWIFAAFLLGAAFFALVMVDFMRLVQEGNSWERNAFLSAYFTLVGTLLMHIIAGLLWMIVLMFQIFLRGITPNILRRAACLRLFWHFLNIVWVFIFAIVYMMGVVI